MVEIRSGHKREVLESRWDEMTSPARFAGCDDTMDLIFVAKRSGGRVRLVRKARIAHEPFCCVFRGKISGSGSGSVIKGVFTKSVADYFIVLLISARQFAIHDKLFDSLLACGCGDAALQHKTCPREIYRDAEQNSRGLEPARIAYQPSGGIVSISPASSKECAIYTAPAFSCSPGEAVPV